MKTVIRISAHMRSVHVTTALINTHKQQRNVLRTPLHHLKREKDGTLLLPLQCTPVCFILSM